VVVLLLEEKSFAQIYEVELGVEQIIAKTATDYVLRVIQENAWLPFWNLFLVQRSQILRMQSSRIFPVNFGMLNIVSVVKYNSL
jgi:hypothetical protein